MWGGYELKHDRSKRTSLNILIHVVHLSVLIDVRKRYSWCYSGHAAFLVRENVLSFSPTTVKRDMAANSVRLSFCHDIMHNHEESSAHAQMVNSLFNSWPAGRCEQYFVVLFVPKNAAFPTCRGLKKNGRSHIFDLFVIMLWKPVRCLNTSQ